VLDYLVGHKGLDSLSSQQSLLFYDEIFFST